MMKLKWIILIMSLCVFITACGPGSEELTATPLPPTAAPELPTATALPPTATPDSRTHILFIGNSDTDYNRGLDNHMEGLASSANPSLIVEGKKIVVWGTSLEAHWLGIQAVPEIQKGNWSVVVLQESMVVLANDETLFYESVRNFKTEIEQVGAETLLFMLWEYGSGEPLTIAEIANVYARISAELGVRVAPVGLAWAKAIYERPGLDLYDRDREHPSIAGTYLTTAVIYATIFGESPEGFPYKPADLVVEGSSLHEQWKMAEDDLAFLQRIAWETVVDYENNQ